MRRLSILTLVLFGICTAGYDAFADDKTPAGLSPEITAGPVERVATDVDDLAKQNAELRAAIRRLDATTLNNRNEMLANNQNLVALQALLRQRLDDVAVKADGKLSPGDAEMMIQAAVNEARNMITAEIDKKDDDVIVYFNRIVADLNNEIYSGVRGLNGRVDGIEMNIADLQTQHQILRDMLNNYRSVHRLAYENLSSDNQNLARAMSVLDLRLAEIAADANARLTPGEAHQKIQAAIDEARGQITAEIAANDRDVIDYFNQTVRDMNNELNLLNDAFTSRIENIETDVADLKQKNEALLASMAQLSELTNAELQKLRAEIATKTDPAAVAEIVLAQTKDLGSKTRTEISEIIIEYKDGFPDVVRNQIEQMVANYVGQKLDVMNKKLDLVQRQGAARERINAAVNKLTEFRLAAGKGSVWKTKEGNFNGTRLASDMTAGVVLGTVGGLVSSNLIKKSQIKNGMEEIRCTVGGQIIAEYGDSFDVGVRR